MKKILNELRIQTLIIAIVSFFSFDALAAVTFVSASNSAELVDTILDGDPNVFVFGNVADGELTDIVFSVDSDFTIKDKLQVKFTLNGKSLTLKKTLSLNAAGCAESSLKLTGINVGTLIAKISYKREKAKASTKVSQ